MDREAVQRTWTTRVEAFAASGLTQRAWCAQEAIPQHQLSYWLRRLRRHSGAAQATSTDGSWCELEVIPRGVPEQGRAWAPITVHIGQAAIEVRPGFDAALLQQVMAVVRTVEARP